MITIRHNVATYCLILLSHGLLATGPVWADEYETRPFANATELLTGELLQSGHHRIESVDINGGSYQFVIDSEFGTYHVQSMTLMGIRVHEIKTLAQAIDQFEKEDDQLSAILRSQLHVSGESAVKIITSPLGTASQLAGQMAENLGETLAGVDILAENGEFRYEDTEPADAIAATHKRNIASQLDLDVYSKNANVQAFLNTVTKERTAGKISAGVALVRNQSPDSNLVENRQLDMVIRLRLKNNSVMELKNINDQMLNKIQVEQDVIRHFLDHAIYSPRQQTVITAYLDYLEGTRNRSVFIRQAMQASDEASSLTYEQLSRMMVLYKTRHDGLEKVYSLLSVMGAITSKGGMVFFTADDITYWSEDTARKYREIINKAKTAGFSNIELVSYGIITPLARRKLEEEGFILYENFLGMFK